MDQARVLVARAYREAAPGSRYVIFSATKPIVASAVWLLIDEGSNTGLRLRSCMHREGWRIEPTMQLDNFDLIINLVSLGMGISFVPIRALALYNQRRKLVRVPLPVSP